MEKYDHAVIGAGIVGSWTALRLLSLDKTVLLLDQFSKPYTQNSSQGNSRIIRIGHKEDFITQMMPIAYDMWKEVETYTKKELIIKTGFVGLESSTENRDNYREYVKQIKTISLENFEELTTAQLNNRYALKFKFESLGGAYFEKGGGSIMAKDALLTIQDLFRKRGGHFWDTCKVYQVIPQGDKVKIATEKGDVIVRSVVVCAGPWTQKLLTPHLIRSLPLQPLSVKAFYWKEKIKGVYDGKKGFPAFLHISEPHVFGLPSIEYPGLMKVAVHGGSPLYDPDNRDKKIDTKLVNTLKDYIKKHLPLLEPEPAMVEHCMYTI